MQVRPRRSKVIKMGSRGPLPKEEGRRQNRRAKSSLRLIESWEQTAVVPEPPDGMDDTQTESWNRYFSSELSALVQETDLPVVRRLWNYYQQHSDLTSIFDKGRLVPGSQGQPRINPAHDAAMKLETAILRLENELGLTPSARLRLGIVMSAAHQSLDSMNDRLSKETISDESLWADEE